MSATAAKKRQDKLLKCLAEFFDYTANFQGSLKEFHQEFREVSKTYDLLDVEKAYEAGLDTHHEQWLPNADYLHDIQSLVNRGHLGIVYDKHPNKERRDRGEIVSIYFLTEAGLDYIRHLEKNFLSKAWDKQPATTLSLFLLVLNISLTVFNVLFTWMSSG